MVKHSLCPDCCLIQPAEWLYQYSPFPFGNVPWSLLFSELRLSAAGKALLTTSQTCTYTQTGKETHQRLNQSAPQPKHMRWPWTTDTLS